METRKKNENLEKLWKFRKKIWKFDEKLLKFRKGFEIWKKWKFENKFENLEIVKRNLGIRGKMWKLGEKSETLEENVEVGEQFGNRKFFGKLGESLEMRGKICKTI